MNAIIIAGMFKDPPTLYGPFINVIAAEEWADHWLTKIPWESVELETEAKTEHTHMNKRGFRDICS